MLDIPVADDLVDRWVEWYLPAPQPFLVPAELAESLGGADGRERLSFEVRDTFWLYDLGPSALVWLGREQAGALPLSVRHAQPQPHRWPSGDRARHDARRAATCWVVPAKERTQLLRHGDGGVRCAGAEDEWMQRDPFERWLGQHTRPGGHDDDSGTVLVWRSADGLVQHAALTIGDGWAIHKPSQGWLSPTKVLTVWDVKFSARARGHHLHRYRLEVDWTGDRDLQDDEAVKLAYDQVAGVYADTFRTTEPEKAIELAMIEHFVSLLPSERPRVLDAGCSRRTVCCCLLSSPAVARRTSARRTGGSVTMSCSIAVCVPLTT